MAEPVLGTRTVLARAAVLGHPISHSLSPVLHSAAYAELGLDGWSYQAVDCTEAGFASWFAGLGPEWRGLSLTMPLKRVVIPLLARISPLALAVGAVNTVTWDDARRPVGDNTDVQGIVEALRSAGVQEVKSACVLGAGATACSAVAALAELGCAEVRLQARSAARAGEALAVADRFGVRAVVAGLDQVAQALEADVLISTLPAAAAADWAGQLRADADGRPAGVLLDVTYHPWPTASASAWTAAGGVAVGGFEMLLRQAAAQVTLMTGREAPLEAMRVAGERALR
jgi:shikimate dehydrogenase